jgi:hypothetical protein
MSTVFPRQKLPDGPVRNITPNGTVRDKGEQSPWGNDWGARGSLNTTKVGTRTQPEGGQEGNRSGEGE